VSDDDSSLYLLESLSGFETGSSVSVLTLSILDVIRI